VERAEMNYFAHGRRFIDQPYLLAGAAVPDWLNVVDRRVRVRSRRAEEWVRHEDGRVAQVARGIVAHHDDDRWFHGTRAFAELSWAFTAQLRDCLPADEGLRPSFLGHVLVELLLDANLGEDDPASLDRYYAALAEVDAELVERTVERIAARGTPRLAEFIPRFVAERFLYDYADDDRLLYRLNQVLRRVELPRLPDSLRAWFPAARRAVRQRQDELLGGAVAPRYVAHQG
jgi:hypothetical protein